MTVADSAEIASVCENCGYEVREGKKHIAEEGEGNCRIVEIDTERVIGWSHRRFRDIYRKQK